MHSAATAPDIVVCGGDPLKVVRHLAVYSRVDERDKLVGLKENVIVGRLIPAGTGGATQHVRKIATDRDSIVIEARREEAEAAAALAAPVEEDVVGAGVFDTVVESTESRE